MILPMKMGFIFYLVPYYGLMAKELKNVVIVHNICL